MKLRALVLAHLLLLTLSSQAQQARYADLGDPQLQSLIADALERNPGVRRAFAEYRAALQRVPQVTTLPAGTPPQGERKILYWRAPMDPNYISDKPGKSPMGMDLIPAYEDEAGGSGSPSGVRVDPSFLQMAIRNIHPGRQLYANVRPALSWRIL